jgi:cytoskeleton protein RodZ
MENTPGFILKEAREEKNLTIAQVVKLTRIRAIYIHALEADDYSMLPSPVQLRGFLRLYAEFLELNPLNVMSLLPPEYQPSNKDIPTESETETIDTESSHVAPSEDFQEAIKNQQTIRNPPFERTMNSGIAPDYGETIEEVNITEIPETNQAYEIFSIIGAQLKARRELLGISIKEVEANTHVLKRYLESIEAGRFDNLETTVQTKGMLSNYAQFLDMDVDDILFKYAEGLQNQRKEIQDQYGFDDKKGRTSNKFFTTIKRVISIDLIFGSLAIIFLLVFLIWGTGRIIDIYREPDVQATSASISDVILTPLNSTAESGESEPLSTAIITEVTAPDTTQISETQVLQPGQVQIHAVILQRAWVRIKVDGVVELEGRVEPGSAYPFSGYDQIEILTSNGAAIEIVYNQNNIGLMGEFGQIVDLIYTSSAILSPTATITPTPTITPIPSRTPLVTATPLP